MSIHSADVVFIQIALASLFLAAIPFYKFKDGALKILLASASLAISSAWLIAYFSGAVYMEGLTRSLGGYLFVISVLLWTFYTRFTDPEHNLKWRLVFLGLNVLFVAGIFYYWFIHDRPASLNEVGSVIERAEKLSPSKRDIFKVFLQRELADSNLTIGELRERLSPPPLSAVLTGLEKQEAATLEESTEISKLLTEFLSNQ